MGGWVDECVGVGLYVLVGMEVCDDRERERERERGRARACVWVGVYICMYVYS